MDTVLRGRDLASEATPGGFVLDIERAGPDRSPADGAIPDLSVRDPGFIRSVAQPFCRWMHAYFRAEVDGLDLLPPQPFIAVTNHGGGPMLPDMWPMLHEFWSRYDVDAPSYALVHDAAFRIPVLGDALRRMGAVPASRANAEAVVAGGGTLLVAPGGDAEAVRSFRQRNRIDLRGRTFFAELAIRYGVPIVPVVNVGGHEGYVTVVSSERLARWSGLRRFARITRVPVNVGLPWGIWATSFFPYLPLPTKISYRVLEPVEPPPAALAGNQHAVQQVYERVEASMRRGIDELASRRRWPVIG